MQACAGGSAAVHPGDETKFFYSAPEPIIRNLFYKRFVGQEQPQHKAGGSCEDIHKFQGCGWYRPMDRK